LGNHFQDDFSTVFIMIDYLYPSLMDKPDPVTVIPLKKDDCITLVAVKPHALSQPGKIGRRHAREERELP
jgi:hypothetical protein